MQAQYSNYDSDSLLSNKVKRGGLNGFQEFRPQPQELTSGVGLLISLKTDVSGVLSIDFTNIISEPFAFVTDYIINATTQQTYTFESAIKAKFFRVRFKNSTVQTQKTFKLFTYILNQSPLVVIDAQSSFKIDQNGNIIVDIQDPSGNFIQIDSLGNIFTRIRDGSGNSIRINPNGNMNTNIYDSSGNNITTLIPTTISNRCIYTHNVYDASYNLLTFTVDNSNPAIITSDIINLGKYKNFDILFEDISALNYTSCLLYLYISKDGINFVKTDYKIYLNYGELTNSLTNCYSNSPYIKLSGYYITGLTINTAYIYMKG